MVFLMYIGLFLLAAVMFSTNTTIAASILEETYDPPSGIKLPNPVTPQRVPVNVPLGTIFLDADTPSQTLRMDAVCRTFTMSDKGKQISLEPEQEFEIVLPDPLVGGFRIDKIDYDESIVNLIDRSYHQSKSEGVDGTFGQLYFRFKTLGVGRSNIDIWIKRVREPARKFFGIQLEVVP